MYHTRYTQSESSELTIVYLVYFYCFAKIFLYTCCWYTGVLQSFRCSVVIVAHSIGIASWNIDYVIVPVVIAELSWEYNFLSVSLNRSTWRNWTESMTLMASVASIVRLTGDRRQAMQSLMYFVSLKQSSCQKITLTCPCISSMYFWWKLIMK